MAEQPTIVADPISSDGSEESWILLDEMDEAMNEIDEQRTTETASQTILPAISIETAEVATEAMSTSTVEQVEDDEDSSFDGKNRFPSDEEDEDSSFGGKNRIPSDEYSDSETYCNDNIT